MSDITLAYQVSLPHGRVYGLLQIEGEPWLTFNRGEMWEAFWLSVAIAIEGRE